MPETTETFGNRWFSATFVWNQGLLLRIDLTGEQIPPSLPRSAHGRELQEIIANFDELTCDRWPMMPLDTASLTPFTLKVLHQLRDSIPRGSHTTYGQLAAACNSPRGARAVGRVMARNPWPLLFPCHRVLASDQSLGGFGPGLDLKRTLLVLEKAIPR